MAAPDGTVDGPALTPELLILCLPPLIPVTEALLHSEAVVYMVMLAVTALLPETVVSPIE